MRPAPPRRRSLVVWITAATGVLALVVAVTSQLWPTPDAVGSVADVGTQAAAKDNPPIVVDARPARRTGTVRHEQPRSVRLPTGLVVPVRAVSTTTDGLLDVPDDIRQAGWWRGGSWLGDPLGSTLLAAHVDSTTQGVGPFAALLDVRRNQRFLVSSATLHQTYRATSLQLLERGSLLRHRWIYSASGSRRLVMVTCAPPYVPGRGGYQNLVVVTAVPVSGPKRREE